MLISASLTRHVLAQSLCVKWRESADAPETFNALRDAYRRLGYIPVSGQGCDTSIYGSKRANMAFRAWHDATHLAHGLDFTPAAEIEVARIQCATVNNPRDKALLWADVAGQVYYFAEFGEFPQDQVAFVLDYLACGKVRKRF